MIIGINGKIGVGKDLTGKIIQYLTSDYKDKYNFVEWIDRVENYGSNTYSKFEVKKFAGKLKQIASLLTGIPVEDFEDQEFKKSYLGAEWGTVQQVPLNSIPPFADIQFNALMSVRELLQKLGTEAIRDGLHHNTWVNALMCDYKRPKMSEYNPSNWIITDVRFPNELEAVVEKGGITIRVIRNPIIVITLDGEKLTLDYNEWLKQKQFYENQGWQFTEHPSETALDDAKFNYEIINDAGIPELIEKVRQILITEKII
jgi:hypothetical protein